MSTFKRLAPLSRGVMMGVLLCGALAVGPATLAAGPQPEAPTAPEAPPAPAAATKATFAVTVIHASRSEGGIDKALADLQKYLTKSFTGYSSFRRLDHRFVEVALGAAGALTLPDTKTLSLKFIEAKKGFIKVHLSLDGLETTINVKDGGLFFQAGRVFKDGILVLAIRGQTQGG